MDVLTPLHVMSSPPPNVTWVVDKLIAEGDRAVVYGESGSMKSWLLMDLALHLASGRDWLGWRVDRQYRVLYVDEEMSKNQDWVRMYRLIVGNGFTADIPLVCINDATYRPTSPLQSTKLLSDIQSKVKAFNPEIVIVETLREVLVGDDKNSTDIVNMFRAMEPLSKGRTLILSHHMNKPPADDTSTRADLKHRLTGSTRIREHVDVLLAISRVGQESQRTAKVSHEKARAAGTQPPWAFRLDATDNERAPARLLRDDAAIEKLLGLYRATGGG